MLLRIFLQMGVYSKKSFKIISPILVALGLLTLDTFDCQAQGVIQWENNYGGSDRDKLNSIQTTQDGGYIMAGATWSTDHDVTDTTGYPTNYWIVKLDKKGNIDWEKTFGGSSWDLVSSVKQTPNGNYIVVGSTKSSDFDISNNYGNYDIWVLKLDSKGNILWKKNYGGSDDDYASEVVVTADNNYVIAANTESDDQDVCNSYKEDPTYWILKINSSGKLIWDRCYGGSDIDRADDLIKTNDGGFLMAGQSYSSDEDVSINYGKSDFWLIKVDSTGQLEWENSYGGSGYERNPVIEKAPNDGYLLAGNISEYDSVTDHHISDYYGNEDIWVAKLDKNGNLFWSENYGGSSIDGVETVEALSDGGFMIGGETSSEDYDVSNTYGDGTLSQQDSWLIRLDDSGNILWENNYGGNGNESCKAIQQINDSSFIVGGWSSSNDIDVTENYGGGDFWVFRLNDTQCPVYNSVDIEACKDFQISGSSEEWSTSGIYKDTFKTTANCDSIVMIDLRIIRDEMDTSVTKVAGNLQAVLQDASYQWLNCDDNYSPVQGATERIFNPPFSGQYAVEITKEGCSDTSSCYQVGTTSIQAKEAGNHVKIYPNPAKDELTIKTAFSKGENITIKLFSLFGKEISVLKTGRVTNHLNNFNLKDIASGTYLLKVTTKDAVITRKIILNK